jgi:hypothetical protein
MSSRCTTQLAVVLPFPLDRVRPPRPSRTEPAGLGKVIPLPVRATVLPFVVPSLPPAA